MQEINGTSSADWQAKVKSEEIGGTYTNLISEPSTVPVLLIDGDIMLHKLHYGKKGGLLLSQINDWIEKHYPVFPVGTCQVIICLSAKPYVKNEIYPAYKGNRKASKDSYKQFLVDFVERVADGDYGSYTVVFSKGFEADDLVYSLATYCDNVERVCHLITQDKDALLCPCPIYWDGVRTDLTDDEREELLWKQAMCGDTGDNIPGYMTELAFKKIFSGIPVNDVRLAVRILNETSRIPTAKLVTPWLVPATKIRKITVEVTDGEDGF